MTREIEVFAELWPIMHAKEKSPAGTEDRNAQLTTIITFSEAVSIDEHLSKVD